MKNELKTNLSGWWIMLICLIIYVAGLHAGQYYGQKAFVPSQGPGSNPPFYFIRNDYISGIFLGASELLILIVAGLSWKRYPIYARMVLWMGILWTGGSIVKSVIIAFHTTNILSPLLSESLWQTFNDYLHDPVIWISQGIVIFTALAIAFITRPRKGSQQGVAPYVAQGAPSGER